MPDIGPLSPDRQDAVTIPYPDVPANLVDKFNNLLTALDSTSRHLDGSAGRVQDFMSQINGAVEHAACLSDGKARQALVQTWLLSQTDGSQAHTGMSTAATQLRAAIAACNDNQPAISNGMAALVAVQNAGGRVPSDQEDEIQGQLTQLSNALNNIGLALDVAATLINKMNSHWPRTCATGFSLESNFAPAFAPHAFDSPARDGLLNMEGKLGDKEAQDQLGEYIQQMPKAEQHVHLEGTVSPETMLDLAAKNHAELPVGTIAEARRWFQFTDFAHFVEVFRGVTQTLRSGADYTRIVYELGQRMKAEGIHYAEVTVTVARPFFTLGMRGEELLNGLEEGRQLVLRDTGVQINWIFDIPRASIGWGEDQARYTVDLAILGKDNGVVALGLGGDEARYPPELFTQWFEKAADAGLYSVPHAGEMAGPGSVWNALNALKAGRIGHGVRAIEDGELVRYLARNKIALEVSPSSNILLRVYPDYQSVPLQKLRAAGVPFTINTDDPALFNTTLTHELGLLPKVYGFDRKTIDDIVLNSIRYSFLSPEQKGVLEARFIAEMLRVAP